MSRVMQPHSDSSSPTPTEKVYPGAPHGITDTHMEQLNADLLAFAQGAAVGSTSSVMAETAGSRR